MIRKVDPFNAVERALLPCDVYPFISGRTPQSYALARTRLKLGCLLHKQLQIPGSLAMQDPFVRGLAIELLPFIRDGQVMLDLRSSCGSFNELASVKYEGAIPYPVSRMADLLDRECPEVVSFDASGTSEQYAIGLIDVIRGFRAKAKGAGVISALENAEQKILVDRDSLTLESASGLMRGTHLQARFLAIAKLFYSLEGARVTNTEPIIPLGLWKSAFPSQSGLALAPLLDEGSLANTDRLVANEIVMDYFSIDAGQIDSLSAFEILDLKREPMTERYIRELDSAVDEAVAQFRIGSPFDDAMQVARDRAIHIGIAVRRRCEIEARRRKKESWMIGAADEIGGATADLVGVGLIRKGLAKLARRIARDHEKLAWVDYTSTPLFGHVSRFRQAVEGDR